MRAVFVGGCGRSGTTLLGDLLGAHPRHVCTPETSYKIQLTRHGWGTPHADLAAGLAAVGGHAKFLDLGVPLPALDQPSLRALFEPIVGAYAAATGKPDADVWIDHTPSNLALGGLLFAEFPDAKLIHLLRDGRAVAASTIPLDWGPNTVTAAAREWVLYIGLGLAVEAAYPDRVLRVRYEDLVRAPARELERVCRFAGLDYTDAMARGGGLRVPSRDASQHALVGKPPDPSRADAWRTSLSARDIESFEATVSALLELLGYEPLYGHRARDLGPIASLALEARDLARALTVNRLRKLRRSGAQDR